jgi:hypothetical protein
MSMRMQKAACQTEEEKGFYESRESYIHKSDNEFSNNVWRVVQPQG